jgi:hypothetical protein
MMISALEICHISCNGHYFSLRKATRILGRGDDRTAVVDCKQKLIRIDHPDDILRCRKPSPHSAQLKRARSIIYIHTIQQQRFPGHAMSPRASDGYLVVQAVGRQYP